MVEIELIKLTAIKLFVTLWPLGTLDFTQNGTASTIEIEDCSKFPNGCCQDLNKNHLPAPGPNQAGCPTHCQCNPLGIVLSPFFTFLHTPDHIFYSFSRLLHVVCHFLSHWRYENIFGSFIVIYWALETSIGLKFDSNMLFGKSPDQEEPLGFSNHELASFKNIVIIQGFLPYATFGPGKIRISQKSH